MITTIMHTINYTMVSGLAGLALGWYLRGRGWTGVETDIGNIKNDILALKNHFFPATPTPVVTPIVTQPVAVAA